MQVSLLAQLSDPFFDLGPITRIWLELQVCLEICDSFCGFPKRFVCFAAMVVCARISGIELEVLGEISDNRFMTA